MSLPAADKYSLLQVAPAVAVNLVGGDEDRTLFDNASAVDADAAGGDEVRREQRNVALGCQIAAERIARRCRRRDFEGAVVDGLDESGIAGDNRRPNAAALVDGAENRHLPAPKEITRTRRKMIRGTFADVLRDVADAGPLL